MKRVLFVCVHNSGRSQMAEAFFNLYAKGEMTGISAGTQPGKEVNPAVVKAMQEIGIDISKNTPKMLTMDMVKTATRMITMGCGADAGGVCPASFIETEDWKLDDPRGKPLEQVRQIRDNIKARIMELIEEMGAKTQ